jgi:hypothetical protein
MAEGIGPRIGFRARSAGYCQRCLPECIPTFIQPVPIGIGKVFSREIVCVPIDVNS